MSNRIFKAVRADNAQDIVQAITDGDDINEKNSIGNTPAIDAARDGHNNALQTLIDHKADLNIQDTFGNTPLIWAVQENNADGVTALLQVDKIDINIRNNMEISAVWTALSLGKIEIAVELIENGADTSGQIYGVDFQKFAERMQADTVLDAIAQQEKADLKGVLTQGFNESAQPSQPHSDLNLLQGLY